MPSIRLAVIYSSLGRYVLMLIVLLNTILVARLLTPSEIGTFAIGSSFVMIMTEFRVLGANAYLIREKNLTENKIRSSYGLTRRVSWTMGFTLLFSSYPLSIFFDIDSLATLFLILSVSFFFAPYISIPHAILSRRYKFGLISKIYIFASLTNLIATITLIHLNFSFYSLAIGNLLAVIVQSILFLISTSDVKIYAPSFKKMGEIAHVGIYASLGHVLRKALFTAPDVLIGKMGSPTQVGFFSRGLGFINFTTETVMSGIFPVVSPYLADVKNAAEDFPDAYIRASQLITGVMCPLLAVASLFSLPAIHLMFGSQWNSAAPIASVIAFWAILKTPHIFSPQAAVTLGYEKQIFFKELVVFTCFLFSAIIGYQLGGIHGASFAFIIVGLIDLALSSFFLKKLVKIQILKHFYHLLPSLFVTIICWIAAYSITIIYPFENNPAIMSLLQASIILPIFWVMSIFIFKHPLRLEITKAIQIALQIRSTKIRKRKKS